MIRPLPERIKTSKNAESAQAKVNFRTTQMQREIILTAGGKVLGGFAGKKWGLGGRVVIVLTTLRTAGCFAAFDIGVKVELEIVVVVIFCPAVVERGTGDGAVSCD